MVKVAAMIPVKLNNQRTPGKNIKELDDGTPLCHLIFNTISKVKNVDEAYCFCSDETIKKYLSGSVKYLPREESLNSQTTTANQLIAAFLEKTDADIIVMTHVTAPFLSEKTIEKCVDVVLNCGYDSATTVEPIREFLWNDQGPMNYDPANIPRTQDLEHIFCETTGLYVFRRELFEQYNRRIGFKPYFHEIGTIEGLDVDYPEDFEIVNAVYMKMKANDN